MRPLSLSLSHKSGAEDNFNIDYPIWSRTNWPLSGGGGGGGDDDDGFNAEMQDSSIIKLQPKVQLNFQSENATGDLLNGNPFSTLRVIPVLSLLTNYFPIN